eukprot:CAMPEP_0173394738 /NCGR_PEP_ID=MMETSP1356-20130122/29114_1 /TAXON_ID=77927 ORGANISM="Hemiselmis virescens, Strain PCC157" /NCGR_SAMPLE_ID=MMETSP1356 /ASSEMBLY_ACC=CAM_ASM_000847 /LENGTH=33 /DNA_ID= /DNA_START= /DNA_END= /DNA_ORIENTATION=
MMASSVATQEAGEGEAEEGDSDFQEGKFSSSAG